MVYDHPEGHIVRDEKALNAMRPYMSDSDNFSTFEGVY